MGIQPPEGTRESLLAMHARREIVVAPLRLHSSELVGAAAPTGSNRQEQHTGSVLRRRSEWHGNRSHDERASPPLEGCPAPLSREGCLSCRTGCRRST